MTCEIHSSFSSSSSSASPDFWHDNESKLVIYEPSSVVHCTAYSLDASSSFFPLHFLPVAVFPFPFLFLETRRWTGVHFTAVQKEEEQQQQLFKVIPGVLYYKANLSVDGGGKMMMIMVSDVDG